MMKPALITTAYRRVPLFAALVGAWGAAASASIIDFAGVPIPSGQLSSYANYGSTDEVTVSYGSYFSDGTLQCNCLWLWRTGYGDLPAAAYHNANVGRGEIVLTPKPGYAITLHGFDMASYGGASYFERMIDVVHSSGTLSLGGINLPRTGHLHFAPRSHRRVRSSFVSATMTATGSTPLHSRHSPSLAPRRPRPRRWNAPERFCPPPTWPRSWPRAVA